MTESMIERVGKAILKARYYDCEPWMYQGEADFFAGLSSDLVHEARIEAIAAVRAVRLDTEERASE